MALLTPSARKELEELLEGFGLTSVLEAVAGILKEKAKLFREIPRAAQVIEKGVRIVKSAAEKTEDLRI